MTCEVYRTHRKRAILLVTGRESDDALDQTLGSCFSVYVIVLKLYCSDTIVVIIGKFILDNFVYLEICPNGRENV